MIKKRQEDIFFEKLAETGIVSLACKASRISRFIAYRRKKIDPDFRRRWEEAEELGLALLEDVAAQRAIEKDTTLLIFLLKTRLRDKYGEKTDHRVTSDIFLHGGELSDEQLKRQLSEAAKQYLSETT